MQLRTLEGLALLLTGLSTSEATPFRPGASDLLVPPPPPPPGPVPGREDSHPPPQPREEAKTPVAHVANGTYLGLWNEKYDQDFFLGVPYAKPPVGDLRFAAPEPLDEAFEEPRPATEYGWMCIGYGSDTSALGNPVSEDCLTLNIVRPAGYKAGDDLPVGVWVHGGSYVNGGSRDPRYNLSYIVDQSVEIRKPMIAVSINYRLSYWGFLFSEEMQQEGAGNVAFKDQRLALQWISDNIAAFGGSPDKVTIWGESAGARSLGMQLIAYDGQHNGLFRGAVLQSGSPVAVFKGAAEWQPYFDALSAKTGCGDVGDRLGCLRQLPWQTLNDVFNNTNPLGVASPIFTAVIDGDFMTDQGANLLKQGKFAKVALLTGNNFDEGTAYGRQGINTDAEFQAWLSSLGLNTQQISDIEAIYPDNPLLGIPAFLIGRPPTVPYGAQFKRAAAFAGDYQQHAGRRLLAESYAAAGLPVFSYLWNVHVNGLPIVFGATHFQEVAFVFNNVNGDGYAINPFATKPESFVELADLMSKMWAAFIHSGSPELNKCKVWPQYTLEKPNNIVFDVNRTALHYVEKDDYREEGISYLLNNIFV
ncbi:Alpha/Beta hydrolase protein [Stachybotrys elegans]|uniref:Carboxylic ester hydrolase n=1 Tax=Stachybotrys elegans TaxID=80388 RepID=A0A8K0SFY9_9HYPO|nr:Alpha/Beta hydrolase protein [Stachybotrys elegans]